MKHQTGVYRIMNMINNKIYIGSTSHKFGFNQRWKQPYNNYLENSFKKYGKENFKFEILLICDPKDCLYYEQKFLDYCEPWIETGKGYNISRDATCSMGGRKHTDESKKKISNSKIGKTASSETKKKQSLVRKGRITKPETIKKLKAAKDLVKRRIERIDCVTGEIKEYESLTIAAKEGFGIGHIWSCCNNKRKKHKGFYWEYQI